jgi:hypothetical protein
VALRWHVEHFGPGAVAFDGQHLVGQVARYDIAEPGRTEVTGHFYVGFRTGERVTERCETLEEALLAVEGAAGLH